MRALTILSALILAMVAGAYGALMLSGGGTSVGEPYVVVPVKPQPMRPPDAKSPATASGGSSGAAAPINSMPSAPPLPPPAPAPRTGESSGGTGSPSVAGVALPATEPAPRAAVPAPAAVSFPGLSIDPATVAGPRMAPVVAPGRGNPTANPSGLGARPGG